MADKRPSNQSRQIKCPKCGHLQPTGHASPGHTCAYCGIVFKKYIQKRDRTAPRPQQETGLEVFVSAVKEQIVEDRERRRRLRWVIPLRVGIVLLFLILTGVGVYKSHHGITRFRHLLSREWPATDGAIIYSALRKEVAFRLGDESEIGMSGKDRNRYYVRPAIAYRYKVDDREYTGTTVSFTEERGKAYSRKIVARFPLGSKCDVYFHPQSPSFSVLIPGLPGISKLECTAEVILGIMISVFSITLIIFRKTIFIFLKLGSLDEFGKEK